MNIKQNYFSVKNIRKIISLFILMTVLNFKPTKAQILIPAGDGGFENATSTFAANNWQEAQPGVNRQWRVGTAGGSVAGGTKCAYLGAAANYNGANTLNVFHFYRDIAIPAGATNVMLSYYLKTPTIDDTYDFFRIYSTTTANTPVAGVLPGAGYTQLFSNTATAYAAFTLMPSIDLTALAGTTVRLVFTAESDGEAPVANPAVDNISLTYTPAPTCAGTPNGGTCAPAVAVKCAGQTHTMSVTGASLPATGLTYQWEISNTGGGIGFTNVAGGAGAATTSYTTAALTAGTYYYRLNVTCATGPATSYSNEVQITVNANPAVTATPSSGTYCTPGGASVQLLAGGATTYSWLPVAGLSPNIGMSVSASPSVATTYTVTGTDANGCTGTATAVINASPTPSMNSITATPTAICAGDVTSLTADATEVIPSPGAGPYTITPIPYAPVSPAGPTGAGPATDDSQVNVPIGFTFTYYGTAYTNIRISSNGVTSFTNAVGGAYTPQFMPDAAVPNAVIALAWTDLDPEQGGSITYYTLNSPTRFVVQYNSVPHLSGLGTPLTGHIILYPDGTIETHIASFSDDGTEVTTSGIENATGTLASVPAGYNNSFWSANNIAFRYTQVANSPVTNYLWSPAVAGAIANPNQQTTNANPVATTIYTVTATASTGCTITSTVSVNILPVVTGSASVTPVAICLGNSATFDGNVPTSCPGGVVSGFQGGYSPANWIFSQDNSNGTVNTGGAPASIIMSSGNNLSGNTGSTKYAYTFTCPGTVSFNWSYSHTDAFGSIFDYPTYSLNGGAPATFTGFITGGSNNQSGTMSIAVNAGDVLQLDAYTIDNDPTPCNITLSNFSAPTPPVGGSVTYWDAPNGGTNVGTPPLNVTPVATGTITYYAQYTALGSGCVNPVRDAVTLTINGNPSVSASATPAIICAGEPSNLSASGAASYGWNPGALAGSPVVMPNATTTYTVVGTDANGCTGTSTVNVTVNSLPSVTASPVTQTVCENGMATISGGGAASYTWTGGIMDATQFMVMAPATYTVTGTDGNGCTNTATAEVLMNATPMVSASATPTTTCNMTSVTPNATGANSYVWTAPLMNGIPFVATTTATYTVTGTDGAGCTATSTVTVTVNPASGVLAPATSNQSQTHDDDFNINYYDGSCDLIATVDDGTGGNILGLTTSTVNVDATAGFHNGQPFVRRWYQITPTSNGSADVILYINQSDFDDYNAVVVAPYLSLPTSGNNADPNVANIRITKNDDAGLGNNPIVITPTVNWNGTYWELSFNTPSFSQFRVHSVNPGGVPLPATVTNFSGMKLESSDKLSWTTASEQNNAYFNLQHSTDGVNFSTIAKVNSKAPNGNSTSTLNYSSVNNKPALGHNYYRLQQVDIDQKVSVHAQIVDLIWGANGSSVSIYPNPTTDILNVDLYTTKAANTTVKLLDMSGRVVKQIQAKSVIGMNNIQLSIGEIASGLYTIQVYENNTLTHTSKVRKND